MKSERHKKLQEIVKDYYKQIGWFAAIEYHLNGKKIDVLAQNVKTKYTIANEIELSPRHCLENIQLDLKVGCKQVVVVCESKAMLEAIRQKTKTNLHRDEFEKVSFRLIQEFIPP